MSKKSDRSNLVRFTQMGVQMGATIGGFAYLGYYLDDYGKHQTWTLTLTLIGVFISMYMVIREVLNMNKDEDEK